MFSCMGVLRDFTKESGHETLGGTKCLYTKELSPCENEMPKNSKLGIPRQHVLHWVCCTFIVLSESILFKKKEIPYFFLCVGRKSF